MKFEFGTVVRLTEKGTGVANDVYVDEALVITGVDKSSLPYRVYGERSGESEWFAEDALEIVADEATTTTSAPVEGVVVTRRVAVNGVTFEKTGDSVKVSQFDDAEVTMTAAQFDAVVAALR